MIIGKKPKMNLAQVLSEACKTYGDERAVVFEGRKVPFKDIDEEVRKRALWLETLGIQIGDRVAFFALYALVKVSAYVTFSNEGWEWNQIGALIWSSEDFAIFSTIMPFWFGGGFLKAALARTNGNGKK